MKTTKILSLVAFLLCFTLNLRAQSGTCGANLTWKLVNDTLIITGSGAMDNSRTWSLYSSSTKVVHVSISEGVTNICDNAFEYHRKLLSVIIPNTVTSIGEDAFRTCTSLKQVTMSNAVETIGSCAFYETAITSITLPSTLISLGTYAFNNCTQLAEITIPGSLSSIADYTFQKCTGLHKLVIEEGVKTIGAFTFEGCSKLNGITIPEGVTSIDINAFQGCSRITEISLPSSLINLGGSVFYGCSSLASIVIPDKITSIENHTFYGCTSLKEVTLPQTILKIEEYAFRDCAFTQFTIPSSATEIQAYAFSYCKNLTSITLPSGMTKIYNNLFDHCSSLTSIVIPEGVTTIGTGAFWECTSLTSVTIPEGVTSIYGSAFYNCNLTSLSLPNSLEVIGNCSGAYYLGAFAHNTNLTSVVIPASVSRIGSYAFEGCTSLSQITLQEGLKEIGANAFQDCGALRSIIIPEGVMTIEEDAFANCRLTEISLPRSLKTIGDDGVFQGNKFLTSVTIYGGVERIGSYAFDGCTSLSQVTLHEGITTIGEFAFQNCSSLRSITLPEGVTTIEGGAFYNCDLRDISLPQSLKTIEDAIYNNSYYHGAFANNSNLTTFVSPDNVTFIGSYTFSGCHSLKNIVLNDNLLTLGTGIFNDCFAMESITFPKKITAIPATAFHECYALSEVNLPEGLISIGEMAFAYCSSLKTVQLPKTVTSLYRSFATSGVVEMEIPEGIAVLELTFDGCSKLKKVTLPSTLTTLGDHTFKNCTSLPTITLPQGLLTIGSYVFSGCTALDSITLPSQLTSIGEEAFMSCSALRNITIPNSVKSIGNKAFGSCKALREITIPNQVKTISAYLFEGCTALTSITLPYSITKINNYAFHDCIALAELTLPEGLTTIGSWAFYNCSALRSLTIPSTVVDLKGSYMFQSCSSLVNLNLLPPTPPAINSDTFTKAPSNLKINLLCGAKEAYLADANWAKLTYPINEIFSNILTVKSNDNRMGEAYIPTPNTCDNDTAIIEALPREGYQFAAWHDGNTDNPRTILVTQDTTFTANFEPLTTYQLTVNYDPKQAHISGTGEYYPNEEATLTVTPLGGYRFKKWGDGNTDNPRTIVMTQDTTLEALFITGDYCGDDILYTFINDTLALNGTGDMWNLSQYGWNMYADEVLALTLSDGITSLGTNAFMDLMFLSEVTIPASVKTIHKRAFENCRSLSSVMFAPNSQLQTIDHWAFYECINLKALEIPEGVTTIGNGAFYGCAYLDSIVLPASMVSIADNGFAQCTKLSAMTVHAVTPPEVDNKTFENVRRSIPVYVPFGAGATYRATPIWQEFDIQEMEAESNDNKIFYTSSDGNIVTPYDETVFGANIISNTYENGEGIITFDGVVTSIGESAFDGCSSLTSITIPHSVTSIGNYTFYYCSSLTSITIPESVTSIGSAFCGCSSLTSITIPYGVPTIEDQVFSGCSSLTSITIPESVTSIGIWSFSGCSSLTSITIPNSVMSIGNSAFFGCSSLTSITIPYGVPTIEDQVFSGCSSLTSITIPESVTSIGSSSFYCCSSLTSITIPESITSIGESAFSGCYSLTSITIPYGVPTIEDQVFSGCSSLASITIPESITSIGHQAFWSCSSLASITIPNGVTTIGDYAFYDCHSLVSSISIPYGVTTIGEHTFYGCVSLPSISIPNSVTSIGYNAFKYCYSFTSVIIPNSVTSIENSAFQYCLSLTSVTIGSSVMTIGAEVFDECPLDTIYCNATIPPSLISTNTFPNYDAILYVPCESLEAYKADSIWGKFSNIQCIDSENPPCEEVSVEFNATFCGSFVWNGVIYTEAGDYVQTIRKTDGCDSIVTMHLLEDCPISPIDPCEDIIELDWRNGVQLSQLSSGWYKLYVGDIHANQSAFTIQIVNDLACPTTMNRAYYANCEDEEPLFEGSATYELGATQQTMTYADFANIVPAHAEFLYLNIESIFEDCAPPCENVHTEEQVTICYGNTYTWNGQTYATEGAYTMTFYTNAGCDSTVTLYLTVLPATIIVEESVVINEEYLPYTWRDLQCYDTGTYTISTPFADYPYCDSVIYVLNLTVEAPNKCGDNLYWHYSNNTMTITGYGAMYDDPELLSYRTQGWYPSRVTHVSLSNEITHIGDVAFADCANLTNIDIPNSVTSIGDGVFSWTGLQSITIPASVTELGEQVFEACNDLHTILYEGNPIAINNQTVHPFIGCVHLDTVITPAALWHCTAADPALEARYGVPHKAHYIEVTDGELTDQAVKYIAQNATTLEILDLTNATNITLPYGAWSNNYQLSTLYLPQQIEVIPESMVEGARNLLEIAIPATVMEIGNYAFAGCVNVWRMTVDAVIPPKVYENTFDGISRSISVQVPAGSEELYREAAYWSEFFIEHTNNPSPITNCQKLLRKDQILILRNGKVYTAMGQLINTEEQSYVTAYERIICIYQKFVVPLQAEYVNTQ